MHDDLCYLSATEALRRFRARTLSPLELLDALIARVESCEPSLNAVCDRRFDEARDEARAAADRHASASGSPLPLDGVPVALKEEHPMRGRSWAQGSLAYETYVARYDHPVVERIQAAGGVVHIRTTTPEFCCAGFTESRLWGATRNPWNLGMSPGGSSGGSGAALAAGYAPIATGSDIGGSIRIPASLCGVVGFKPPYGRVPALPPFNLDQYCHDGPMARTVADAALLENVIAGRHPADVVSLPDPPVVPAAGRGVGGMRVALSVHLGDFPIEPEIEANTRAVAAALADAGAIVTEVELPWRHRDVLAAAQAHFGTIFAPFVAEQLAKHPDLLTDYAVRFAREMVAADGGFVGGLEIEGDLWRSLGALFEQHDALVCPTLGTRGFPIGEHYVDATLTVAGVELPHYLLGCLTLPFNIASRCPVLSLPSGWADNGVPTGVQLVGRTYADADVFELGLALESAGFGWTRPPDLVTS